MANSNQTITQRLAIDLSANTENETFGPFTYSDNAIIVVHVMARDLNDSGKNITISTTAGSLNGVTWYEVEENDFSTDDHHAVFLALGGASGDTDGECTIDVGSNGNSNWTGDIYDITGANVSSPISSNALIQSAKASSRTATLASAVTTNNVAYAFSAWRGSQTSSNAETGWTSYGGVFNNEQSNADGYQCDDDSDNSHTMTGVSSNPTIVGTIIFELETAATTNDYTITGAVTVSTTVAASAMTFNNNDTIAGAVTVPITVAASAMTYNYVAEIAGDVTVPTTIAATMQFNNNDEIAGDVTVPITVAASAMTFNNNDEIAGDVTVPITVAASAMDYTLNATITGDVTVPTTIASTMVYAGGNEIAGDVTVPITVAASAMDYTLNATITGDVTVPITIAASAMTFNNNDVLSGSVTVTVDPTASVLDYTLNRTIAGAVTVSIDPTASALTFNNNDVIAGAVTVPITIAASAMTYSPAAKEITGDITVPITVAATKIFSGTEIIRPNDTRVRGGWQKNDASLEPHNAINETVRDDTVFARSRLNPDGVDDDWECGFANPVGTPASTGTATLYYVRRLSEGDATTVFNCTFEILNNTEVIASTGVVQLVRSWDPYTLNFECADIDDWSQVHMKVKPVYVSGDSGRAAISFAYIEFPLESTAGNVINGAVTVPVTVAASAMTYTEQQLDAPVIALVSKDSSSVTISIADSNSPNRPINFYYRDAADSNWIPWTIGIAAGTSTYTYVGLTTGNTYDFAARFQDTSAFDESPWSNTLSDITVQAENTIEGVVVVDVAPAATLDFVAIDEIVGDVTVSITPSASFQFGEGQLQGDITVAITVASAMEYSDTEEFFLTGQVGIPITIDGSPGLMVLTGDVTVAISVGSGMLYTPDRLGQGSAVNNTQIAIPPLLDPTDSYSPENESEFRRRVEEALVDINRALMEIQQRIS